MRKMLTAIAALGLTATALPAAAQSWQNINARQAQLDARIDQGIRSGDLTRREAIRLRTEFKSIADLEARYRRSGHGLTAEERRELDRRFDALAQQVYAEKHDRQQRS
jgi:hypothetical protein